MLEGLKKLFKAPVAEEVKAPFVAAEPDKRGAPGTRVYHEYFIDLEPRPDGFHWLCRVYAQNGAVTERAGVAVNQSLAKDEALTWANRAKAGLRGE